MAVVRKATKKDVKPKQEPANEIHILDVSESTTRWSIRDPGGNERHYHRLGSALDAATEWAERQQEAVEVYNGYGPIVTITPKPRRESR